MAAIFAVRQCFYTDAVYRQVSLTLEMSVFRIYCPLGFALLVAAVRMFVQADSILLEHRRRNGLSGASWRWPGWRQLIWCPGDRAVLILVRLFFAWRTGMTGYRGAGFSVHL